MNIHDVYVHSSLAYFSSFLLSLLISIDVINVRKKYLKTTKTTFLS